MDATIEVLTRIAGQDTRQAKTEVTEKPGYYLPFVHISALGEPYSADGNLYRSPVPRPRVVLRRLVVAVFVATTNTGANYWTINLRLATAGVVASVNTSALAPDTWAIVEDTTFTTDVILQTADKYFLIDIAKTGAPGTLTLSPAVYCV